LKFKALLKQNREISKNYLMKNKIKEYIGDPEKLEQLYNADKNAFKSGFEEIYPEIEKSELARYWKIRLDYNSMTEKILKSGPVEIIILISVCLITGFLIKIPDIFNVRLTEIFYEKNAGIIVFFGLTLYVAWTKRIPEIKKLVPVFVIFMIMTVYVNLLPSVTDSASINLVYIHLPLMMWFIYGLVFIDFNLNDKLRRIEYIRYNGDLAIFIAIMVIAGGILTGITIGLFNAIGLHIETFYMENVVIVGAVSIPIVATYITRNYAVLTNKIAPLIANIFSPMVLLTAVIFLAALAVSGKDPYSDREFLLIFNVMLIGVMAVIVFSISETSATKKQKFNELILFVLSIVTVIIDLIALSAIFYRLGTFGITPNRLAVLGSNILILANLAWLIPELYKVNFRKALIEEVELTIARYLPVYLIWILFVIIGFPLIFSLG
jgi:hypothetical protein